MVSTAKEAANAKPGRHRVGGADGLYLNLGANGGGSWFFRYSATVDGKPRHREMGLGARASVSIDEARQKAKKLDVRHGDGHDPLEARRQTRRQTRAAAKAAAKRIAFRQAAHDFLETNAPTWKRRYSHANWKGVIERYALPVLGDMTLEDIEHRQGDDDGYRSRQRRDRAPPSGRDLQNHRKGASAGAVRLQPPQSGRRPHDEARKADETQGRA
jgi:hypothetical protein